MALTQEQKNTISLVSQQPELVLSDFKHRNNYLHSFKNEFFQDGTGIVHKVLSQYLITDNTIFLDLYQYIINHSKLTINDKSGHKLDVLSYLFTFQNSIENFHYKIFNILNITNIFNESYSYLIENNINGLYKENFKAESLLLISQYHPLLSGYRELLIEVVANDDITFFNTLITYDLDKSRFLTIDFHTNFITQSAYKNILYYALEKGSHNIAQLLLDNYPQLVSNESNQTHSNHKKFTPILETINKLPDFLEKTMSFMTNKILSKNFNYMTQNNEKLLTELLNNHYCLSLENQVIHVLNSDIEGYEKTNILKSVFESSISYDKKFYILSCGLEEKISELYSNMAVFNSFIFSIQKNPDITQNLFDQFINEFNLRDLISEDQVFNSQYFSHMDYFKLIHNNYLFSTINPLNFVESYLKNIKKPILFTDDMDFIWYKISQLDFPILSCQQKSLHACHIMIMNNFDRFVNFFPEKSLSFLLEKSFNVSSYNKFKNSQDFYSITEKLIDTGFRFNMSESNTIDFLSFLSFNPPKKILDKIFELQPISFLELSKEKKFWNYINEQDTFNYCVEHHALLNNTEHIMSLVNCYDFLPLELYLKNNGSVDYHNEKGNILHYLCQSNGSLKKEEMLILLDYHPHLAIDTNKQNKFAVSYLLKDFHKLCTTYQSNIFNNTNNKSLNNYYQVIKKIFQCGLHSNNKKAFNILESQLLKYPEINEIFPDLLPILRAEKLSKKLIVKNIDIKKIKI